MTLRGCEAAGWMDCHHRVCGGLRAGHCSKADGTAFQESGCLRVLALCVMWRALLLGAVDGRMCCL